MGVFFESCEGENQSGNMDQLKKLGLTAASN